MNKKPNRIFYNVIFPKNFEQIKNTGFIKGRARIAYAGENRNYSNISREVFDNALNSLSLIPVVGNWIPEKNNFGGHDISLEEVGNSLKMIDKTRPYGVVPENHNAEWVDVEDSNGNIKRYLECDVILWKERYEDPIQKIIDGGVNQSMEIVPTDANYNDKTGYFDINSFYYSALCLLGRDEENLENNVEPCFEDSQVVAYQFNLDKDEFKSEFSLMMAELKQSLFEGGEGVEDNKFEEEMVEIVEETTEEFTEKVEESTENVEEATVDTSEETEESTEEFNEEVVEEVEDKTNDDENSSSEEVLSMDDYNKLLADYELLKTEYETLQSENEELKSFKSDVLAQHKASEVEEVFSKYSTLLDAADFEDLKENAINMEIAELEKELSFRLVQKKFDFSKITKKDSTKITIKENKDSNEPYGSASVYFNK